MKKVTTLILMLCLTFSGALCNANGMAGTEKGKDGISIVLIENSSHSSSEKGNSIIATINGHLLTVVFTEDLGQVAIAITTDSGSPVDSIAMSTPNGYQYYIPNTGDYVVTFTLPNGDEYYGEFTVTD